MRETVTLRAATFRELDATTLYALLRLRTDVFVVEQQCAYPELDGRDLEPATWHLWFERAGTPVAYLRVLDEPDGTACIGRVVVAPEARGNGLARRLLVTALERVGDRDCVMNAQSRLVEFYEAFGFIPTGPEFLDDGILHTPMRRSARPAQPGAAS